MKNLRKMFLFVGLGLLAVALGGVMGQAATIDFDMGAPTSGTITFAGGSAPLVGTGIEVDTVNAGGPTIPIVNGVLSFTTGSFNQQLGNDYYFNGGGTIQLTGSIPSLGLGTTTFILGSFTDAEIQLSSGLFKVAIAGFTDTKDAGFLAALFPNTSIGAGPYAGNLNLSFYGTTASNGAIRSTQLLSGDLANEIPVPEPSLIMLLGIGVMGISGCWRKFVK